MNIKCIIIWRLVYVIPTLTSSFLEDEKSNYGVVLRTCDLNVTRCSAVELFFTRIEFDKRNNEKRGCLVVKNLTLVPGIFFAFIYAVTLRNSPSSNTHTLKLNCIVVSRLIGTLEEYVNRYFCYYSIKTRWKKYILEKIIEGPVRILGPVRIICC